MGRLTYFAKWWAGTAFVMSYTHRMKLIVGLLSICLVASPCSAAWRLTWEPNVEPELAGYKIYYGAGSRTYTQTIDVGNVTEWFIPDEQPDGYFAATAYDTESNESNFSGEVLFTRDGGFPIPATGLVVQWVEVKKSNVFYITSGLQAQDAGKPIGQNTFYITSGLHGYDQGGP